MMHLSRWSEELILWQSQPFACIDIGEAYCTGSSIMPQKKNPDVPELVRGKCGRVYGALLALLTLMKGQPLAYNRDNQEDKAPLFDAVDTVKSCVRIYTGLIPAITVRRERLRELARQGCATATDLADYLVGKGLPFREAHAGAGRAVAHALAAGKDLAELSLEELRTFSDRIGSDVYDWLSLEGSVARRKHAGATAPAEVRAALERARTRLEQLMMDTKGEAA
jgi:argininosuccinate lyase